jgi:hypothetical protein
VSVKFLQLLYLFQEYGYLIIFSGTFFEGETTLVLGGLISHQGHLNFLDSRRHRRFCLLFGPLGFLFPGENRLPLDFSEISQVPNEDTTGRGTYPPS